MEVPKQIQELYRHWGFHINKNLIDCEVFMDVEYKKQIEWFIHERIKIWEKKYSMESKPYTKDAILQKYRFCNILREFDRQTIEFHTILNPHRDNFFLWLLNMFYFRMVANTGTVKKLGLLNFHNGEEFYKKFKVLSKPKFGTSYVFPVSVILKSKFPTREEFISFYLPTIISSIANEIEQFKKISVTDALDKILPIFGFNLRFLWTEVLIDIAYQYPGYIDLFADFPSGPGSRPTLKKINSQINPENLSKMLANTRFSTNVVYNGKGLMLSSENWEGICCEFRKYENLMKGQGRKRRY